MYVFKKFVSIVKNIQGPIVKQISFLIILEKEILQQNLCKMCDFK